MNNLEIINNNKRTEGVNILEVEFDENGEPFVWGRKLHSALKIATAYKDWFPRMCEYGFNEKIDYTTVFCDKENSKLKNEHVENLTPQQRSGVFATVLTELFILIGYGAWIESKNKDKKE